MERVENMMCMLYFDFWFEPFTEKKWGLFYTKILDKLTFISLDGGAKFHYIYLFLYASKIRCICLLQVYLINDL